MRYHALLLAIAFSFALFLPGCGGGGGSVASGSSGEPQVPASGLTGSSSGAGSIEVRVAFDGAGPSQKVFIDRYDIFIADTATGNPITKSQTVFPPNTSVTFSGVPIGNRTIFVDAFNKDNQPTAHGSFQVNILPGTNNSASVQLQPDPHVVQILAEGQNSPAGITVIGDRVYWIEKVAGGSVKSAPVNPTGEAPTPHATVKSGPTVDLLHRDLVSYGSQLFWCDYDSGTSKFSINKIDISNGTAAGNDTNTPLSGRLAVNSTAVYAACSKYVTMFDPVAKRFPHSLFPGSGKPFSPPWAFGAGIAADDSNVWVLTNKAVSNDSLAINDASFSTNFGLFGGINNGNQYRHIAVDNTYVYWTEWGGLLGNGRILRAKKSDGSDVTVLVSGLNNPKHPRPDRHYSDTMASDRLFWVDDDGLHQISGVGNSPFSTITGPTKSLWNPPGSPAPKVENLTFVPQNPDVKPAATDLKGGTLFWTSDDGNGKGNVYKLNR